MNLTRARHILFYLLAFILFEESLRDSWLEGDLVGYVIAGDYAWHAKDIYSHWLNTWPPLFSLFGIVVYAIDSISPLGLRILWQLGSLWAVWHIFKRLSLLVYQKPLVLNRAVKQEEMSFLDIRFQVPFFLAFKYILDNTANLQINIYMLALCIEGIYLWKIANKPVPAALLFGITLALKVYTLFFVVWFLFTRQWKVFFATIAWVLLLNIPVFLFFGVDLTLHYYQYWWKEIAQGFPMILHKNQSLFAAIWRLTVEEDAGLGISTNLISLSMDEAKRFTYVLVLLIGSWPAMQLFRLSQNKEKSLKGMALFLALIPLLSPLAWKAYFIFLLPAQFILVKAWFDKKLSKWEKWVFVVSHILLIISSDIFVGPYVSDLAELYSLITFGAILLVSLLLFPFFRLSSNKTSK